MATAMASSAWRARCATPMPSAWPRSPTACASAPAGSTTASWCCPGIDDAADIVEMRRLRLESVVHHVSQLELLAAAPPGDPLRVWLKVDTGMHRLGFPPERVAATHAAPAHAGVGRPAHHPDDPFRQLRRVRRPDHAHADRALRAAGAGARWRAFAGQFGRGAGLSRIARRVGTRGRLALRDLRGGGKGRRRISGSSPR